MSYERNAPCPCGSGKKYKKCCGKARPSLPDFSLPEDQMTGTPLDGYLELMPILSLWLQKEMDFGDARKDLKGQIAAFERKFRPGDPDGITDSIFMPWQMLELRYGRSGKTVYERMMESSLMKELPAQVRNLLGQLDGSCNAWYRMHRITSEWFTFVELGTEREWNVFTTGAPEDRELNVGELWYVRLVGPAEAAYIFSAPFVFPPDAEDLIRTLVVSTWNTRGPGNEMQGADRAAFVAYNRAAAFFWNGFILRHDDVKDEVAEIIGTYAEESGPPQIVNYDGHEMLITTIRFTVKHRAAVEKALRRLKSMEYDEDQGVWVWTKKSRKRRSLGEYLKLASLTLEDELLTAETNSLERAQALRERLEKSCGPVLRFEGMESKTVDALPPLTAEARDEIDRKNAELANDPVVQEQLASKLSNYYLTDWVRTRLPALGNKTPEAAAKTDKGREALRALLNDFEHKDRRYKGPGSLRMDWDRLRNHLGI